MSELELFEKIEVYISGELSKEEQQVFEQQIESNPLLAQEVEMHRLEHDAMNVLVAHEIRGKMQTWSQELPTSSNNSKNKGFHWMWILPMILVVGGLVVWFNQPKEQNIPKTPPSEKIPTQQESNPATEEIKTEEQKEQKQPEQQPTKKTDKPVAEIKQKTNINTEYIAMAEQLYDSPDVSGTRLLGAENELQKVKDAYQDGKFEEVVKLLENATAQDLEAQRILGHAYFRLKQFKSATEAFENIQKSGQISKTEEIEFYLLLSYLAESKLEEYNELLERLQQDIGHPSYNKVMNLEKLK